jgi:hypothetical protein
MKWRATNPTTKQLSKTTFGSDERERDDAIKNAYQQASVCNSRKKAKFSSLGPDLVLQLPPTWHAVFGG